MVDSVVISECFARDGLQNEPDFVATDTKISLLDRFSALGFARIEATSYSNPKAVPQFADATQVLSGMSKREGAFYKATCANLRAVDRANADFDAGFGANEISLLASATEAHTQKNLRASKAEQWQRIGQMAKAAGGRYRIIGSLSVVFGCPFEKEVDPAVVVADCAKFAEHGIRHISLGDTTGLATPYTVKALFNRLHTELPEMTFIAHFHDTRGAGVANCVAAYDAGCRWFDSAIGGVGGHPSKIKYGGGFTGNVATEDLVNLFESMGINTGVDLDALMTTAALCEQVLGRALHGKTALTGPSPLIKEKLDA